MGLSTHSLSRKAYRSDLRDSQWRRIKRLLPKAKRRGRPRANEREVLNGILYVLSTGCRWEDLPHDIAVAHQTCNRRLLDYQRRRVWQRILGELLKEADRRCLISRTLTMTPASSNPKGGQRPSRILRKAPDLRPQASLGDRRAGQSVELHSEQGESA